MPHFPVIAILALAVAASNASAAGPARTPLPYTAKVIQSGNTNPVSQITLDHAYAWDSGNSVRTTFDNRPDSLSRGNPSLSFLHRNGLLSSRLDFSSSMGASGASAVASFQRIGVAGTTNLAQSATPDSNGTTYLNLRFADGRVSADLLFWSARSGYFDVLRSGGYYGSGGFFSVPDEYRTGSFSGGLTTFRFESNQDSGTARLLYNFANDGGENGTVRARLLYLDRNGEDGYNKVRFSYVSNAKPASPY